MKLFYSFLLAFFILTGQAKAQAGKPFINAAEKNGFTLTEMSKAEWELYNSLDTSNAECLLIQGIYTYKRASYMEAIKIFDKSISIYPSAEAYFLRAGCKRQLGDTVGENNDYQQAVKLDSSFKDYIIYVRWTRYLRSAEIAMSEKQYIQASNNYTRMIELNPAHAESFYMRGISKENTGDTVGATQDFSAAIRLDGKFDQVLQTYRLDELYSTAYDKWNNGDWEQALTECDLILTSDPSSAKTHFLKGKILDGTDNISGADAAYQKAIELDSSYHDYANEYRIGKLHESARSRNGDLNGALADYTEALKIDSSFSWTWYERGTIKEQMQDNQGARADFKRAFKLDSMNAEIIYSIGNMESKYGNYSEAITMYDRITAYGLNSYKSLFYIIYLLRGEAKRLQKDYLGAIEDYTMLISYDRENPEYYRKRGLLYTELKKRNEACSDFSQANLLQKGIADEYISKYCK